MRILGIDPGSTATGFGVVEQTGTALVHVAHGTVRPPRNAPLAARLLHLHRAVLEVIAAHRPDVAAVEEVFVAASPRAALVLGQARGAVLAALAAGQLGVSEYAAARIKQAVTGNGRAGKPQVQKMVCRLLALDQTPPSDASDALAAAICHAHAGRLGALVASRGGGRRSPRGRIAVQVRRSR
jgi:crossover junction endodeoxyribonuclease RuvC